MRPGKERRRVTRPKEVVVVMVGRETQAGRRARARRRRPRATGPDWVGVTGQWRAGGHLPGWTWETRARQGMARHGARQGRTGQGMAGDRAGTGSWAHWALGKWRGGGRGSKTVHRPHANQNRLDPPDGDDPRARQGRPLLGVYQQLSGPERLKSEGFGPCCAYCVPGVVL